MRLSAVYGGTYMLAKPDAQVVYDEAGGSLRTSTPPTLCSNKLEPTRMYEHST